MAASIAALACTSCKCEFATGIADDDDGMRFGRKGAVGGKVETDPPKLGTGDPPTDRLLYPLLLPMTLLGDGCPIARQVSATLDAMIP